MDEEQSSNENRLTSTQDVQRQVATDELGRQQRPDPTERRSAVIDGARSVVISGGTLNHIHGNHTTINYFDTPLNQGLLPSQDSQSAHASQSFAAPSYSSYTESSTNLNLPPVDEEDIIMSSGPGSIENYSPKSSCDIYKEQLQLHKRGTPLWTPEPNEFLPVAYQRRGVTIGDVGIFTCFGGFSFLFNICLPRDDPIQPPDLPEDFVPFGPIPQWDLQQFSSGLQQGSHLASETIKKIKNSHPSTCLTFETTASEGAILTIPEGAVPCDLGNTADIEAYAAANIESWYRYINGPRGRKVKNGEVRLVIGFDKTTSWGMAVISSHNQHVLHRLTYREIGDDANTSASNSSSIRLYGWEYSDFVEPRAGPEREKVESLRNADPAEQETARYSNQCLFVRTLNIELEEDIFSAINQELEEARNTRYQQQSQLRNAQQNINFEAQRASAPQTPSALGHVAKERATMSISPSAPVSHPADVLNRRILERAPSCSVVITQDKHWCSVINEDDEFMPNGKEIADRVLGTYAIIENNGVATLESLELKTEISSRTPSTIMNVSQTIAGQQQRLLKQMPQNHRDSDSVSNHQSDVLNVHYIPKSPNNEDDNNNDDGFNSDSSPTSPVLSNSRGLEGLPQPSIAFTENYLRKSMSIPENQPLDLSSLPDGPFGTPPKISDLITLAIWGSPNRRLTTQQIFDAVEKRYPSWKDADDKPLQLSIRRNLSQKAMFVPLEQHPQGDPGMGYYWTLNVAYGDSNRVTDTTADYPPSPYSYMQEDAHQSAYSSLSSRLSTLLDVDIDDEEMAGGSPRQQSVNHP